MRIEDIQADLRLKSRLAAEFAQHKVEAIIRRFIEEYYSSYSPTEYERLYQLYSGIIEVPVQQVGNGWVATVIFDTSLLDYNTGTFTGQEVFDAASQGIHPVRTDKGGPVMGAPAWREGEITAQSVGCLKQAIMEAGIPIG